MGAPHCRCTVSGKDTLGRATLRGLLWLSFQSAGARLIGIVSQIALARLLLPAQFGVISLVYILTGVASTVTSFGVDGVLLQRSRSARLWSRAAFWTSLTLGAAGLALVLALGPVFAHLYRSPQITSLAGVLALSMPLGALATVPSVRMRSEMNFRFPALYSTGETFATTLATILLACFGAGAMSFVIPTPAAALVKAVVFWLHSPARFNARARLAQYRYLVDNGLSIFGSRLIVQLIGQGDYAVLGLFASHSVVGFYYFAFRLAAQPVWILAGNFTNVLFPALVQVKADPARQLAAALRAAELLSYVVMPVCFLQAAAAAPGLEVFFGRRWEQSVALVRLLSLGIPFDAAPWVAGSILSARREFRRGFLYALATLPAFFALVTAGAALGRAQGVAACVAIYYLLLGPVFSMVTFGRYGARPADIARLYVKPPLISGGAVAAAWGLSLLPGLRDWPLLRLAEMGAAAPVLYALLLARFEPGVLADLVQRLGLERLYRRAAAVLPARRTARIGSPE